MTSDLWESNYSVSSGLTAAAARLAPALNEVISYRLTQNKVLYFFTSNLYLRLEEKKKKLISTQTSLENQNHKTRTIKPSCKA